MSNYDTPATSWTTVAKYAIAALSLITTVFVFTAFLEYQETVDELTTEFKKVAAENQELKRAIYENQRRSR